MTEADIQSAIRIALGAEPDLTLYRNSVGVGDVDGRKSRFGLCKGSSDLVGMLTLHLDGQPRAVWFCLEVKTPIGRLSPEQKLFLDLVRRRGGFAAVARSVDEARDALTRARAGGVE